MVFVPEREIGKELDDLAELRLVEFGARVVLGQHAEKARVLLFQVEHRLIDQRADGRLDAGRPALQVIPARALRDPEDVVAEIEIAFVDEVFLLRVGERLPAPFLEAVGNIFEKDEAERDVLVFRGVHVTAQLVRRRPERRLEGQRRLCAGPRCGCRPWFSATRQFRSSPLPQTAAAPRTIKHQCYAIANQPRVSTLRTLIACQRPPRGVGTPRALRASAMARSVVVPDLRISAMSGRTLPAARSASALMARPRARGRHRSSACRA